LETGHWQNKDGIWFKKIQNFGFQDVDAGVNIIGHDRPPAGFFLKTDNLTVTGQGDHPVVNGIGQIVKGQRGQRAGAFVVRH
jgi:hypothetical protein